MKNRVRAVIIKDNKILLIKRTRPNLSYWVIPGGGVEEKESNEEALARECLEELGVEVKVKELLFDCLSEKAETFNQREYFYLVDILSGVIGSGQGEEFTNNHRGFGGYDIEWRSLNSLSKLDLKPLSIKNLIIEKYCNN